jgi:AmmeMemoRadiSam system protein A
MAKLEEDGQRLVVLAREAIAHELGGPEPVRPKGPWFEQEAATFVTVARRGLLHGCIGTIAPRCSLVDDVVHNAVAAAFHDPRAERFRSEWLPDMGVEVTLLGPLEPMRFADRADAVRQIVPGADGLLLRCGPYRSTFLPQVWESLPDPQDFLRELEEKAGLPRSSWSEGVELHRFRVQKWGDRRAPRVTGAPRREIAS